MKLTMALILALTAGRALAMSDPDRMAQFYTWHPHPVDPELVRYAGQETERYGKLIGLTPPQTRIMLCMWHRESAYDQHADDSAVVGFKKRSLGITQTRRDYFKRLRRFWKIRGVTLGSFDDPSTQIAFGVAEFHEKLQQSHGVLFDAVRRYNGGGPGASPRNQARARAYARRVFVTRRVVYGDPRPKL